MLSSRSTMPTTSSVQQPKLFQGNLKDYQLKGLQWLVNCYEQVLWFCMALLLSHLLPSVIMGENLSNTWRFILLAMLSPSWKSLKLLSPFYLERLSIIVSMLIAICKPDEFADASVSFALGIEWHTCRWDGPGKDYTGHGFSCSSCRGNIF